MTGGTSGLRTAKTGIFLCKHLDIIIMYLKAGQLWGAKTKEIK